MKAIRANDAAMGVVARSIQRDSEERVIRVDRFDRAQGSAGKLDVHREGLLHRAFSILVFDSAGQLLLQQRADCKYHFAGLWSNSCCGHPRPGESTYRAAVRRLEEEFGFSIPLREFLKLVYRAGDPVSRLVEFEYLHVFRGVFHGEPQPNPEEVGAWSWMSVTEIGRRIETSPESFTPWFALLFERIFSAGTGSVVPIELGRGSSSAE